MSDQSPEQGPDQTGDQESADQATGQAAGAHAATATDSAGNRKALIGVVAAVVVLALAIGGFLFLRGGKDDEAATAPTATGTTAPKQTAAQASSAAVPAGCAPEHTPMTDPKVFAIDRMNVRSEMLSLGQDKSGAAAAPPLDNLEKAKNQVGWYNGGPRIGGPKGNAVLTIHTYHTGGALGNKLYESKNGFKTGDLVKMTDSTGKTLCYTLARTTKVMVKDYDPKSTVLYDFEGKPQAVAVICEDWNTKTRDWDSRVLYYMTPVGKVANA